MRWHRTTWWGRQTKRTQDAETPQNPYGLLMGWKKRGGRERERVATLQWSRLQIERERKREESCFFSLGHNERTWGDSVFLDLLFTSGTVFHSWWSRTRRSVRWSDCEKGMEGKGKNKHKQSKVFPEFSFITLFLSTFNLVAAFVIFSVHLTVCFLYTGLILGHRTGVYPRLQSTTPFIIIRVIWQEWILFFLFFLNDNHTTNNNHVLIIVYARLRRAESIGN